MKDELSRRLRRRSLSSLNYKKRDELKSNGRKKRRLIKKISLLSRNKLRKIVLSIMKQAGNKTLRVVTQEHGRNSLVIQSLRDINHLSTVMLKKIASSDRPQPILKVTKLASGKKLFEDSPTNPLFRHGVGPEQ